MIRKKAHSLTPVVHGGDRLQITRPTERRGRLSSGEVAQRLPGRFDVTIPGAPADVDNNASSPVHQFLQGELDAALAASKATSPGLDGLPYEVYKLPEVGQVGMKKVPTTSYLQSCPVVRRPAVGLAQRWPCSSVQERGYE